jgi:rfaE bifunctional protein nucleotidyltransferase chain/domain
MSILINSTEELTQLKAKLNGSILVATNGCFDILHVGHVRYLQEAKKLGTHLIVGVNSDESVKELKGSTRPINKAEDRAEILNALACVDFTYIFTEKTANSFLGLAKPDIYVKGGDYNLKELPEKKVIEEIGAKVVLVSFQNGYSTSSIISRF